MNIIESKNKTLIQMQNLDQLYIQHSKSSNIILVKIQDEKIEISELDYKEEKKVNQEFIESITNLQKNKSKK